MLVKITTELCADGKSLCAISPGKDSITLFPDGGDHLAGELNAGGAINTDIKS